MIGVSMWQNKANVAITVCDREGIIVEMNEASCRMFEKSGGAGLIGKNLLDCHPGSSRQKLENMLKTREQNCYTTEKNGIKKLIYQIPWFDDKGEYQGFAEMVMEIPFDMPHFVRN